jgi:hypothetical protein
MPSPDAIRIAKRAVGIGSDFPGDRPMSGRRDAQAPLETNNYSESESIDAAPPPEPLQWLDMSAWDHKPIPERKWAIRDRVPLNQAGLFSGEGGTGKSIIELTKNIAHVTGKDWLGSMPEPGPAFYIGAEDFFARPIREPARSR